MSKFLLQNTGLVINIAGEFNSDDIDQYIEEIFDIKFLQNKIQINEQNYLLFSQYSIQNENEVDFVYCEVNSDEQVFLLNAEKFYAEYFVQMVKAKTLYEPFDFIPANKESK